MAELIDGVEYLSGEEAALMLSVKRATLYAYVSRGMVRSYRQGVGRRRLYRRDEIERLRAVRPEETISRTPSAGWESLPDERPTLSDSADLPDAATWAGDH